MKRLKAWNPAEASAAPAQVGSRPNPSNGAPARDQSNSRRI